MATNSIFDDWLLGPPPRSVAAHTLRRLYKLQETFLFHQYEPTKAFPAHEGTSFIRRLEQWVLDFDEKDRWAAFHSIRYLFFAGHAETEEMYRCAVQSKLLPWIATQANLNIFSESFDNDLREEVKKTWTCPLTDSLRINGFLHRTGLLSRPIRPDWYSLKRLGHEGKIKAYAESKNLEHLALFDDFVGSGTQCEDTIKFALQCFPGKIFFCPLVICEPGDMKMQKLAEENPNKFFYEPLILITKDCLIQENSDPNEPKSFEALRSAFKNGYKKIDEELSGEAFGHEKVGCLYTSYSNCPNNTPPIYHKVSPSWGNPIFPRESRI